MEKDFDKQLENGVELTALAERYKSEIVHLDSRIEQVTKQIEETKKDVVSEPDKIKDLEATLKALETRKKHLENSINEIEKKKIQEQVAENAEKGEVKENEIPEETVQQEDIKEKNEEKEEELEGADTEKGYQDAMVKLHAYRMALYNSMVGGGDKDSKTRIVKTEEEMAKEKELIAKASSLRGQELTSEEKAKLEEQQVKEKKAQEPIQKEIQDRCKKYQELMLEMYKLDKRLAEINRIRDAGNMNDADYEKERAEILDRKRKIREKIKDINPKELKKAVEQQKEIRAAEYGLREDINQNLSEEERKNQSYQARKKD